MKYLSFLFIFTLSCTTPTKEEKSTFTQLKAETISLEGVDLFKVEHLFSHNGDYVAVENSGDYYLKIFSKKGKFKKNVARKGLGPNEFKDLVARSFISGDGLIQGIEASNNAFHFLKIDADDEEAALEKIQQIQMPLRTQFVNDGIAFGDSLIIGSSNGDLMEEEVFKYHVAQDALEEMAIPNNIPFLEDISQPAKYELLFKKFVKHPVKEQFALLYTKFGQVQIYDLEMNLLNEWRKDSDIQKLTEAVENNRVNYDEVASYNLSVAASEDYIFGLSLGKTNNEMKAMTPEAMMSFQPLVYVWDWKGNLVATLKLDRPLAAITYDQEQNILVGVSPFVENEIYTYALSNFDR